MPPNQIPTKTQIKSIFGDIIRGYSIIPQTEFFPTFYIKHLNHLDASDMDYHFDIYLEEAKKSDIITLEEKQNQLIEEGSWSTQKDTEIHDSQEYIKNLKITKTKELTQEYKNAVQSQIDEAEIKLNRLLEEKHSLLGYTAEMYANRKIEEYFIYRYSFKTNKLKARLFTLSSYDELSDTELNTLKTQYKEIISDRFSTTNLKRVALNNLFLNTFYLCKNNPFTYFGRAVTDLSFYQAELFGYGLYFKHIIGEYQDKIPPEIRYDPDKLVEWFDAQKAAEEHMEKINKKQNNKRQKGKDGISFQSVVGARKEDHSRLGLDSEQSIDIGKLAKQKGGSLKMEDFINLNI